MRADGGNALSGSEGNMRDTFAVVRYRNSEIALSLVSWSAFRRLSFFLAKKLGLINRLDVALFVPSCEIAIFDGDPSVVPLKKPFIVFYYPDHEAARRKLDELASLVQEGGLTGAPLTTFIRNGHPREQGCMLGEDL